MLKSNSQINPPGNESWASVADQADEESLSSRLGEGKKFQKALSPYI